MRHLRTPAVIKLTREEAVFILDQALLSARANDAKVALIRPAALCAVMKADPALVVWERCTDMQHRPVYRGMTLEISDSLYPMRVEKQMSGITRGMRAVPQGGAA